jgi:hypothetical protein
MSTVRAARRRHDGDSGVSDCGVFLMELAVGRVIGYLDQPDADRLPPYHGA